ncbi:MAG: hypothetical protein GX039_07325 [Clostridia bacterium]|nr:hypothetical protein [Clostridia bacterium]
MKWIDVDTVKAIHCRVIKATGGIDAIRDEKLLVSAINAPLATFDGKELYPDLITKVAVLLERCLKPSSRTSLPTVEIRKTLP